MRSYAKWVLLTEWLEYDMNSSLKELALKMIGNYGLDCIRSWEIIMLKNELLPSCFGIRDVRNAKLELMHGLEPVDIFLSNRVQEVVHSLIWVNVDTKGMFASKSPTE